MEMLCYMDESMSKMKKENKKITDYIRTMKYRILRYFIGIILISSILIFKIITNESIIAIVLFIMLILVNFTIYDIQVYFNLVRVEKFLPKKYRDEYYEFFNNKDCLLAEKYMVFIQKKVYFLKYSDIMAISKMSSYKYNFWRNRSNLQLKKYICICTIDNKKYRIEDFDITVQNSEVINIQEYLINKNKEIVFSDI